MIRRLTAVAAVLLFTLGACSDGSSESDATALGAATEPPARLVELASFDEVPEPPPPVVEYTFDQSLEWSMPDRFGLDLDSDGFLDIPNTAEYAQTADGRFEVFLDGSGSSVAVTVDGEPDAVEILTYRWRIDSEALPSPIRHETSGPVLAARLPEGPARIEFTMVVSGPDGWTSGSHVEHIEVNDILIVVLGDSYASGDGNPDVPRRGDTGALWADPFGPSGEAHAAASRSSGAWPVQAAVAIERADPQTSVTFVTVAASGARIGRGILRPQGSVARQSQLDQVEAIVGDRAIDALSVSIGGNDIGFGRIIAGLVDADPQFDPLCYEKDLEAIVASIRDGDWTRSTSLAYRPKLSNPVRVSCVMGDDGDGPQLPGLDGLPDELDRLAAAIEERLSPRRTYLLEYPEPSSGPDGTMCDEVVGDAISFLTTHEIDSAEQRMSLVEVVNPLNAVLGEAALQHGWILLDGVRSAFEDGHGYCSSWPAYSAVPDGVDPLDEPTAWYRSDGTTVSAEGVTWFRTAAQSAVLQGPDDRTRTTGTLHPNELGHAAIADVLLAQWRW